MGDLIDTLVVDTNALFGLLVSGNGTQFCIKYAEIMQNLARLRTAYQESERAHNQRIAVLQAQIKEMEAAHEQDHTA